MSALAQGQQLADALLHTIAARMPVSLQQLAWYIERDGWRLLGAAERDGEMHYRYGATVLGVPMERAVPQRLMPELERERDRAAAQLRARRAR